MAAKPLGAKSLLQEGRSHSKNGSEGPARSPNGGGLMPTWAGLHGCSLGQMLRHRGKLELAQEKTLQFEGRRKLGQMYRGRHAIAGKAKGPATCHPTLQEIAQDRPSQLKMKSGLPV